MKKSVGMAHKLWLLNYFFKFIEINNICFIMNLNKYKLDFKEHPQKTLKRLSTQNVLISFNHDAKLLNKKYTV